MNKRIKRLTAADGSRKCAIRKLYFKDLISIDKKTTEEEYKKKCLECEMYNKLADLEDLEAKLGVNLYRFLVELNYVVSNASETIGYTTDRKPIPADYGYVQDFLERLKKALK